MTGRLSSGMTGACVMVVHVTQPYRQARLLATAQEERRELESAPCTYIPGKVQTLGQ